MQSIEAALSPVAAQSGAPGPELSTGPGSHEKAAARLVSLGLVVAGVGMLAWLWLRRSAAKGVSISLSEDAHGEDGSAADPLRDNKEFAKKAKEYAVLDSLDPASLTELISLLKTHKPRLYMSKRCPYCLVQGMAIHNIRDSLEVVDCGVDAERCRADGIHSLPHWRLSEGHDHIGLLRKRALLKMLKGLSMAA